jgi:hypothetical protein
MVELSDVKWNDEARQKILLDSDRVLQKAVSDAAASMSNGDRDEIYKFLFEALKDQFIDFEPGPDISKYADAIAAGEIAAGNPASGG